MLAKLKNLKPDAYIFLVSLIFLAALWTFNFSNKLIAASFIPLLIVFQIKLRNIKSSAFLTFLVSSIIFSGKNYPQQIIPAGVLPLEIYPFGFFIHYTVTPGLILQIFLIFLLIRDFLNGQITKLNTGLIDIMLVIFFIWPVMADLIASKDPNFSLLYSITGFLTLFFYLYVKYFARKIKDIHKYFIAVVSALVIFESLISLQQYLAKSPVYKNMESQVNIEYFGNAGDEISFAFRPLGTFTHANSLGIWLGGILVIFLLIFLTKPTRQNAGIFAMGFATLSATLSRSSWLGFLIGSLTCLLIVEKVKHLRFPETTYKYLRTFLFLSPVLLVFFIFPRLEKSTNTFSAGGAYFREVQARRAVDSIEANPVFGVGTGRSVQEGLSSLDPADKDTSIVQNIHNWYILGIIEHGFPYVALFLIIIFLYIKKFFRKIANSGISINNINGIIHLGLFGGVICSLIAGIFQPFLNLQIILIAISLLEND